MENYEILGTIGEGCGRPLPRSSAANVVAVYCPFARGQRLTVPLTARGCVRRTYGIVLKARQKETGATVAIKKFKVRARPPERRRGQRRFLRSRPRHREWAARLS